VATPNVESGSGRTNAAAKIPAEEYQTIIFVPLLKPLPVNPLLRRRIKLSIFPEGLM
jgi:hypothetical protein